MANVKPVILLVEDNDDDAFIATRAFGTAQIDALITRADDGQAAIDYIQGTGIYTDRTIYPLPDLVLLDLKLPQKNGLEVLRWIRENEVFKPIVVLIMTSSSERNDVEQAYRLNANAYMVKPTSMNLMVEIAQHIQRFWLNSSVVLRPTLVLPFLITAGKLI